MKTKILFTEKSFTLLELIIVMIISGILIATLTPAFFTYNNVAALDNSAQKLFSDLMEIRSYTMAGRWQPGAGGLRLYGPRDSGWSVFRFGCGGLWSSPYGYKTMIDTAHDCSQVTSFPVACGQFDYLKSSDTNDRAERSEDTTFEDNVVIDSSSEIKRGNMIFFDCNGMPYFASACGWFRVPMTNSNNEIILKYDIPSSTNKITIRIDPNTGKATVVR